MGKASRRDTGVFRSRKCGADDGNCISIAGFTKGMNLYDFYLCLNSCIYTKIALEILRMEQEEVIGSKENKSVAYNMVWWEIEQLSHGEEEITFVVNRA